MQPIYQLLLLIMATCFSLETFARCDRTGNMITADSYAAPLNFGKLNLSSAYLQPVGTVLGTTAVPPSNNNLPSNTALWTCDKADLPYIHFLIATNGDENYGGAVLVGQSDGLDQVYATLWQYIGLKQWMDGQVLTRYWQIMEIKTYAEDPKTGKISIRLQDIPPLIATLYRVSNQYPAVSRHTFCPGTQKDRMLVSGSYIKGINEKGMQTGLCNQPSAYIQLAKIRNSPPTMYFAHDFAGEDSDSRYNFFGANNGFPYGLNTAPSSTVSQAATCVARNATPIVNFPPVAATQLKNGGTVEANFNVEVECSQSAAPGTASDQNAIGFQPSTASYLNAQKLGLINANGSVQYLVSDDYQNTESAKGVGVLLRNPQTQKNMHFLSQYAIAGGANVAGWYSVTEGNPQYLGSNQPGYMSFLQEYTAILKGLPGINPTPGKVKATATVVVKLQ